MKRTLWLAPLFLLGCTDDGGTTPDPDPKPSALVYTVTDAEFGAVPGDTADDAGAFTKAFAKAASAPAGERATVRVPPGVYLIASPVRPVSNSRLEIMPGATLRAKARTNVVVLKLDTLQNVEIFGGGTIDGNLSQQTGTVPGTNSADGITVNAGQDISIHHLRVEHTKGWGIGVWRASRVRVHHVDVFGVREKGVNLGSGTRASQVDSSSIYTVGGGTYASNGIEVDDGADSILVLNNDIRAATHGISIHSHAADTSPKNIRIIGNTIRDSGLFGVWLGVNRAALSDLEDVLIEGNSILGGVQHGVEVGSAGGTGTRTNRRVMIRGNTIDGTLWAPIGVHHGDSVVVTKNTTKRSVQQSGVWAITPPGGFAISRLWITENTCADNAQDGIRLQNVSGVRVRGNVCAGNRGYGAQEMGASNGNEFVTNDLRSNGVGGLKTVGAATVVTGNQL